MIYCFMERKKQLSTVRLPVAILDSDERVYLMRQRRSWCKCTTNTFCYCPSLTLANSYRSDLLCLTKLLHLKVSRAQSLRNYYITY